MEHAGDNHLIRDRSPQHVNNQKVLERNTYTNRY